MARTKKNKRGGGRRSRRRRNSTGSRSNSRFKTRPLETPEGLRLELTGYPTQSTSNDDDIFRRHGELLGHTPIPDNMEIPAYLFQEIKDDPNIEHIKKLEEEYLKIREELERLKQKVYIDHQFQFDTIKRMMGSRF